MKTLLKALIGLLMLVVVLIAAVVIYVTQVLDPNAYRQDIEILAQNNNVPLKLNGPISWQLLPNLALDIKDVLVGDAIQPLLKANHLSASLAIAPLFRGQVIIAGISLNGVEVRLLADQQGQGNWQELTEGSTKPKAAPTSAKGTEPIAIASAEPKPKELDLEVNNLNINQLTVYYQDQQTGAKAVFNVPTCVMQDFNTQGQLFTLDCQSVIAIEGQHQLGVAAKGTMATDKTQHKLDIQQLQLVVTNGSEPMTVSIQGAIDTVSQAAQLQLSVAAFNAKRWLQAGQVELPPMSSAKALSRVAVSAQLNSNAPAWQLSNLNLVVDESTFTGSVSQSATGAISLNLNGDKLNIDDYLAPAASSATQPTTAGKTSTSKNSTSKTTTAVSKSDSENSRRLADDALPLEDLKEVVALVNITIKQLQANKVALQNVALEASVNNGLATLKQAQADLYKGKVQANGQLDARRTPAKLTLASQLTTVELLPLLTAAVAEERLSGVANLNLNISASGNSLAAWQNSTGGKLLLGASSLAVNELDIERKFCELAALTNRKPVPTLDWKGNTTLQDVVADLTFDGTNIKINNLQAGVEDLQVKGTGTSDYLKGDFDVRANLRVTGQSNPERLCQIRDRWRNRDLPLRCRGNIDSELGGDVCVPDKDRLGDLLRDEAKAEVETKLQDKLTDKLGTEGGAAADKLLRGIFGR